MTRSLIVNIAWTALAVALFIVALQWVPARAGEVCPKGTVAASWYGKESGHRTATGAFFNGQQWLVAHKTLRFGTRLRLTYHGRSVVVPVGDRGPYIAGRVLDLSEAVARALGTIHAGVACVVMEVR